MRPATLVPANIMSSAANTAAENVSTDSGKLGGAEKTPDTVLNKIVRVVAGVSNPDAANAALKFNRKDSQSIETEDPRDQLAGLSKARVSVAKEIHKLAHNKSKITDIATAGLNVVYMAGAAIGKPAEGLISTARRIEQGLSLGRRFITGAKINSGSRMLAAFLGLPALVVKNVGKDMYLYSGGQSALGNFAEDALEASQPEGGVYKNLFDEPKALFKKLGTSFKELLDPSVKKDEKWIGESQIMSLMNMAGSAILAVGLATGKHELARTGRNLQSVGVDMTKATSDNIERGASGLGFGFEMALDAANDKLFKGESSRLSALVALSGQLGRVLGVVYQDTPFSPNLPKIYTKPLEFLKMATASMVKYVNPLALATKQHKADNKFEEALGLLSKPLEAADKAMVPAQLSVEAKLKAADKAVVGSSSNSKVSSRSYSSSSREDYSDYSSSSRGAAAAGETRNNALVDKVLEGALNDKDINSSTQDAIALSNINPSTQDAIALSNINSSTQDAIALSNINPSTQDAIALSNINPSAQDEIDTAFPKSA
jgi:hypothetical protein